MVSCSDFSLKSLQETSPSSNSESPKIRANLAPDLSAFLNWDPALSDPKFTFKFSYGILSLICSAYIIACKILFSPKQTKKQSML